MKINPNTNNMDSITKTKNNSEIVQPELEAPKIDHQAMLGEAEKLLNEPPSQPDSALPNKDEFISAFIAKPANEWLKDAATRPTPKKLCGELWYEGETCIFYADTGAGKSLMAVQIGEAIATGGNYSNPTSLTEMQTALYVETEPQKVLYFDFELSDKQFELRYSEKGENGFCKNHYQFSENFIRCEINPDVNIPALFEDFESYINFSIEEEVTTHDARVLIIDNITYLRTELDKGREAIPLMQKLKQLKRRHGLSVMALAHTPKRDDTKPLSINDLAGSKNLMNFCDSSFAIGKSQKDKNLRYIKQMKVRNADFYFDSEHVATIQISKPVNFTGFEFLDFSNEAAHLRTLNENERENLITRCKQMKEEGKNYREISSELGIAVGTVSKYLKK
jgi:hypothetical protein